MPDTRDHRGPHPEDERLFARDNLARLRQATHDLSWLLSRDYATPSAIKLVGDRYALDARQRLAVGRCACSDAAAARRRRHEISPLVLKERAIAIDTFNLLTSLEAALSGGVILCARDGCYRDMASMHGSYRKVTETLPALRLFGEWLDRRNVTSCHWLLDQPVSNSGRLKRLMMELAEQRGWNWTAELVLDPDAVLRESPLIVVTADSQILDRVDSWLNAARLAIDELIPEAWIVNLSAPSDSLAPNDLPPQTIE